MVEGLGVHGLVVQKIAGGDVQFMAVLGEDVPAAGVGLLYDIFDLLVDLGGHLLGIGAGLGHGAARKISSLSLP